MGVSGLETLIERKHPEACQFVSIKELADAHRKKFNCTPTIVVDGMGALYQLYESHLDALYGGQYTQFEKKLRDFVELFNGIGVKLVFIFDGTVTVSKRGEWVRRQRSRHAIIDSKFYEMRQNEGEGSCKKSVSLDRGLPACFSNLIRIAAKGLGVEVQQTDVEADEVIAAYAANNNNVFGILAQDTDFIIFNIKKYLSLRHLDLKNLTTRHYDGNRLARELGLSLSQLRLFACLSGNDYTSFEELRHFHRSLSNNGPIKLFAFAPSLARMIQSNGWSGNPSNAEEMERIASKVFGNVHKKNVMYEGLKSYDVQSFQLSPPNLCINVRPDVANEVYKRHRDCTNTFFVLCLLSNKEYGCSVVFEDRSKGSIPASLLYRRIRQRCYSVLFQGESGMKVEEWCSCIGHPTEAEYIEPEPLESYVKVPTIEQIWFKYTAQEKMSLFRSILRAPIGLETLLEVPQDRIVLTCVLNYLIGSRDHRPQLTPMDVAVFVAQAVHEKDPSVLEALQVPWSSANAVNLATLFLFGVVIVSGASDVCGHAFPASCAVPSSYFDGKLFHCMYIEATRKPIFSIRKLCKDQVGMIKKFYEVLSAVVDNTVYAFDKLDWTTILEDFMFP